ncbi:Hypothetical predicted protein [Paramuricea clavata]|uniref:Uncharacterized protein n=1 Tax=Paramuricea clavata TaxID=317549 RepID=A0A7D9EES5_PARCT|nr:Hypothetical predicted protein [Paramuricea clavata]
MANIRMITGIPETYEDLTWVFIKTIPTGYTRIDIVADTYPENSIKAAEHCRRGSSREIIIRSPQSKIPRDFRGFLQNGKNKKRMIMLMREVLMKNQQKTLEMLNCKEIFFSTLDDCIKITENCSCNIEGLASNQEEADTKVVLHCKSAPASSLNKSIILRSPSGDTDITRIMIEKFIEESANCFLDYGSGQNRMGLWLNRVDLDKPLKECVIGFHAFTGNDFVSSSFRKGNELCWKVFHAFQNLGVNWNLSDAIFDLLEEFVCFAYGDRRKSVNFVRHQMFQAKYKKHSKMVDLSLLPPCQSVLKLHGRRANFVAKIWKSSDEAKVQIPEISRHGWKSTGEIK